MFRPPVLRPFITAFRAALGMSALGVSVLGIVSAPRAGAEVPGRGAARRGMVVVPAGRFQPLYATAHGATTAVRSFAIDQRLVTREQFLSFVASHADWRRGTIRPTFAEAEYLASWPSPTDAGDAGERSRPVTNVSWFAAKAYCAAQGKRLATTDEWEYVAAASETKRNASADAGFLRRLAALYAARPQARGITNAYGVSDMHAPVWEWTLDFNDVVVSDDSRTTGGGVDARDHRLFCASAAIGANDLMNYPAFLRAAMRAGLTGRATLDGLGFRCATDVA
jgi:formylglycine-generating enzyme required for sulfatase activity